MRARCVRDVSGPNTDRRAVKPPPSLSLRSGVVIVSKLKMVLGSGEVCIGVMADIQYRNTEDVPLENHGHVRSYRAALPKTVEGELLRP